MKPEDREVLEMMKSMILDKDTEYWRRLVLKEQMLTNIKWYPFLNDEDKDIYQDEIEAINVFF